MQTDLLKLLPVRHHRNPQASGRTLAGLITDSTAAANLTIERMDSEESGRLNLNLGGTLEELKWLDEVETRGEPGIAAAGGQPPSHDPGRA